MTAKSKIAATFEFICGTIYLTSGMLKAADSAMFARILDGYGIHLLAYCAPFIIGLEILLGALLIFRLYPRQAGAASIIMLAVLTCGYTYGLLWHDIDDCGCFGNLRIIDSNPIILYVRNATLLAMSAFIFACSDSSKPSPARLRNSGVAIAIISIIAAFTCGHTFRVPPKQSTQPRQEPVALASTPLADIVDISPDQSALVFAFSYTCPHCLNSIANLNQYAAKGAVDTVIGIALGDSLGEAAFRADFSPAFPIINSPEAVRSLTNNLPHAFYVDRDSLIVDFGGELPCPQVFTSILHSHTN